MCLLETEGPCLLETEGPCLLETEGPCLLETEWPCWLLEDGNFILREGSTDENEENVVVMHLSIFEARSGHHIFIFCILLA